MPYASILVLWTLVLVLQVLGGCGRKAPSTIPDRSPMIAVKDLQGSLDKDTVRISWRHSPDNSGAVGYIVLRAQSSLDKPNCPDCPQVFQKVDTVPVSRALRRQQTEMEFVQNVMSGFRYTYKVRPYQSSGSQGPDSNLLVISYPKNQ